MGPGLDLFAAVSPEGAWTVTQVTRRARAPGGAGSEPLRVPGEDPGVNEWAGGNRGFTPGGPGGPGHLCDRPRAFRRDCGEEI